MSKENKCNEDKLSFNEHDRAYLSNLVDGVYTKVAEVLIAQNQKFFSEQDNMRDRIGRHCERLEDHERRIKRLEGKL